MNPTVPTTKIPGRLLAWTALVVALGASVAANVAFARPELGPRLSASTAPVLTVLAAGLMERVPLAQARRWQRWLAWLGLSAVAGAAFITSYEHQYNLLLIYGNPVLSAILLPIAVDGLIVLASVCLAVIAERRRALSAMPDTIEDRPGAQVVPTVDLEPSAQATDRMMSAPRPPRAKRYTPSVAEKVTRYADKHPDATPAVIAKRIGVSERTVRRHLATLTADQPVSGMPDTESAEQVAGPDGPGARNYWEVQRRRADNRVNGTEVPSLVGVLAD